MTDAKIDFMGNWDLPDTNSWENEKTVAPPEVPSSKGWIASTQKGIKKEQSNTAILTLIANQY